MNRFTIYLLAIGTFLTGTVALVIGGIVNIIAKDLHISLALTGQLVTAYSLACAIGAPLAVSYTSKYDRKKTLIIALSFFILANLITIWSPNFYILLLGRLLFGISGGLYTIVALSVAAKLTPPEKMGQAIGTVIMGSSTSLVFGVPAGVLITQFFHWKAIFLILAILSSFVMYGIVRKLPSIEGEASVPFKQQFKLLKETKIITGLLISLFWIASYALIYTYLTPFLQTTIHLSVSEISWTMMLLGVFAVLGSKLGGFGTDRFGTSQMIVSSLIINMLALFSLEFITATLVKTLAIAIFWMCFAWMTAPAIQSYLIKQSGQNSSLILSLNNSVMQLGTASGAALGGLILGASHTVTFNPLFAGILLIVSLLASWISISLQPKTVSSV
ncbi:MFS transporter, DHA1 family, putative efflux transporter [Seinonella peptonophila]|uniref:MFS transporter, DHA1 family, putative efflux transporter n=1 Tax=Seinonella peptonophila TaxID=112248 RepID=A0A1M4WHV8_9BACL|nr:MFS transporter [Seinonella peptonophila]SHE80816.1 MFS transporter, DHA1 family, putative efflux transporter [Seinonella peptonophila]